MADISSTTVIYRQDNGLSRPRNSPYNYIEIVAETPATADAADTFAINLDNYGISNIKSIKAFRHATNYSVIAPGTAPTTAFAAGGATGTVTLGTGISNEKYVIVIGGY